MSHDAISRVYHGDSVKDLRLSEFDWRYQTTNKELVNHYPGETPPASVKAEDGTMT